MERVTDVEPFVAGQDGIYWLDAWMKAYPALRIGITSRSFSNASTSRNLALHVEDDSARVINNRLALAMVNGVSLDCMTCAVQTHGANIVEVTAENRGAGATDYASSIPDTDGLITALSNTLLALFFADCVPLFFFEPKSKAIGIAHAGWRGTVANIATKMVRKFQDFYGVKGDTIRVAIGPAIGACCYQVDDAVYISVEKVLGNDIARVATEDGVGHYRLDLQKTNQILLERAGIMPAHIEISHYCTSCHNGIFFSHRKEQGKTGRMAAFAVWKGGAS